MNESINESNGMLIFLGGVLAGIGVSVVANFIYDITATAIGNRLIRNRILFKPTGHIYPLVFTEVCGTVVISKSNWGWLIKKGSVPLSIRLTFNSSDSQPVKTLAKWKMDMDEYTTTSVKLGSVREFILVTLLSNFTWKPNLSWFRDSRRANHAGRLGHGYRDYRWRYTRHLFVYSSKRNHN